MIAKILTFVILAAVAASCIGCGFTSSGSEPTLASTVHESPRKIGQLRSAEITESSGLAASACQSDVLWTHNDSGDDAFLFAASKTGVHLGTWKVSGAENADWEDIAGFKDKSGKCFVLIGEIGDNKLRRPEHIIYRIPEPQVSGAGSSSSRSQPLISEPAESIRYTYPDTDHDAETMMVHPSTADIYVVTKKVSGAAGVYRIRPTFGSPDPQRAERIGDLSVPAVPNGLLTGGDIAPDGRRMVISDYSRGYEYTLPAGETEFGKIWSQPPVAFDLGKRKGGESVCYSADGMSILATSEGKNSPIMEVRRKP